VNRAYRPSCGWADVALIAIMINLVVLVTTPVLRPDLNLLEKSLSYYAIGPWGALQSIAFVALGLASISLGIALLQARIGSIWLWSIVSLLVVSGIASLGLVWYPMSAPGPATILGDAHQSAGTIGGVAQLFATLAFTAAIRTNPAWSSLFSTALAATIISIGGALLSQASIWWPHLGIPMGATMRLMAIPLIVLWGLVALRLRQTCR
jgi:Protein of unknown function (DUF998)